jgi:hypothetical protein
MFKLLMACFLPVLAMSQDYRGTVRQVHTGRASSAIEFGECRLNSMVFAHEGPDYFPIKTPPVAGREYLVEAQIYAIEEVGDIRFELLDEAGRAVQTLAMWKTSDASDDGQFAGLLRVPAHPFRCVAVGTDRRGVAFRRAYPRLLRPIANSAPEPDPLPSSLNDPQFAGQLRNALEKERQLTRARADQARNAYPGGVIHLSKVQFLGMSYEPFVSPKGSVLGVRLHYSMVPGADAMIGVVPRVFPWYEMPDWRGVVSMTPVQGSISPQPEAEGVASISDVILYHGRALYHAGVTYSITVDLIPDFVIQGRLSGSFCVYEAKFGGRARERWESVRDSGAAVKYPVSITDIDFAGEIPLFFAQRTFYESFVREGARDCGPQPTNRF